MPQKKKNKPPLQPVIIPVQQTCANDCIPVGSCLTSVAVLLYEGDVENLGQFRNTLYANNGVLLHFPLRECVKLIVQGFWGFAYSLCHLLFIVFISSCFTLADDKTAVAAE